MKRIYQRLFNALAVSAVALGATGAQASDGWENLQIIDMTTALDFSGDVVVTTGFLHDLDVIDYEDVALSVAPDGFIIEDSPSRHSGWAGVVEVEMNEEPTLPFEEISAFSDTFADTGEETRMSGFYTMRYQFETDLPFRPYAGAGLGLVATDSATHTGGIVAGRATAGFDLTVGEDAAIFAEYAFVKSGGVSLGTSSGNGASGGTFPDSEHSLKLGFRRTF